NAKERPFLDFHSAVRGIAWAYANVNIEDMAMVFKAVDEMPPSALRDNFAAGVKYALKFADWERPGALKAVAKKTPRPLAQEALVEMAELRARGGPFPPPVQ